MSRLTENIKIRIIKIIPKVLGESDQFNIEYYYKGKYIGFSSSVAQIFNCTNGLKAFCLLMGIKSKK